MSENEKPQYDPFAVPEGYDPNATEQPGAAANSAAGRTVV